MEKIAWHTNPHQSGFGIAALALQAISKGRNSRRCAAPRDPRFEHQFKLSHYLPVPFCVALPNAVVECWLAHRRPRSRREHT